MCRLTYHALAIVPPPIRTALTMRVLGILIGLPGTIRIVGWTMTTTSSRRLAIRTMPSSGTDMPGVAEEVEEKSLKINSPWCKDGQACPLMVCSNAT